MQKMSFIVDNVLEQNEFAEYQHYLQTTSIYRTLEIDNKKFYITDVPNGLKEKLIKTIEIHQNRKINMLLCLVRKATQYLDKEWGIHADWNVGTVEAPDYGAVFYISENTAELNGTALWRHKKHGYCLDKNMSYDEKVTLTEESYKNVDDWELQTIVGGKENRLFAYPAEYFHSKFPKQAWGALPHDSRLVITMFYSVI